MKDYKDIDLQQDMEFVKSILDGEENTWHQFVEEYTDWVFYSANHFTRRKAVDSREGKRAVYDTDGKEKYTYTEEAADAYLWIFEQLKKKLKKYAGKIPLSLYIWIILDVKQKKHFLKLDYYKWRYGNAQYIPSVIQQQDEELQEVFKLLRKRKSEEKIALKLGMTLERAADYVAQITEILIKEESIYLISSPIKLGLPPTVQEADILPSHVRVLLGKVIDKYYQVLKKLTKEQCQLLVYRYNENCSAKQIIEMYREIDLPLPGKASIQSSEMDPKNWTVF